MMAATIYSCRSLSSLSPLVAKASCSWKKYSHRRSLDRLSPKSGLPIPPSLDSFEGENSETIARLLSPFWHTRLINEREEGGALRGRQPMRGEKGESRDSFQATKKKYYNFLDRHILKNRRFSSMHLCNIMFDSEEHNKRLHSKCESI